jgi:hypothetical protein
MSPSINFDLQLPHCPSLQPCISEMPWRNAASTVSPLFDFHLNAQRLELDP